MSVATTYEDPRAHAVRERYLALFGGEGLPVPVEAIAEDLLGLRIEESWDIDCSGMLLPAEWRIVLNAHERVGGRNDPPLRRFRFTIAHEIGHWVCHCLEGRAPDPEPSYCRPVDLTEAADRKLEREANVLPPNSSCPSRPSASRGVSWKRSIHALLASTSPQPRCSGGSTASVSLDDPKRSGTQPRSHELAATHASPRRSPPENELMNWDEVEHELARAFEGKLDRIDEAVVVHLDSPLALGPVLESALSEDERDEHGDLESSPGDVHELLVEADAQVSLLGFYWESLGPMSWVAGMVLVGRERRRYLCVWDETESYRAFAAVEPWDDSRALVAAVSAYLVCNGRDHGDGLFGSLPHEVTSHRPDLLPTADVKQALFDYMQWAESVDPGAWSLLAEEHYGRIVEPDHLQRSLDVLETMGSIDLDEIEADSTAMSDDARQRLFDEWFATAYTTD
jgi:hypothetical protein